MRAVLALWVLVLLAPGVAASGPGCVAAAVATVCAFDASAASGSCETQGYAYGYDLVLVATPVAFADAYAGRSCYAGPGLQQETQSVAADAFTPVAAAQVQWASYTQSDAAGESQGCSIQVVVGAFVGGWQNVSVPCPAGGPPDAGWGDLLP